jgi:hypothetical protein
MTKAKLIPVTLGLLVVVLGSVAWYMDNRSLQPRFDASLPDNGTSTFETLNDNRNSTTKDRAWSVFEGYLNASKSHDVKKLNDFAYRLSDVCLNKSEQDTCYTRMDQVYSNGSEFKKEDFIHLAYDGRQIILSTDWKLEETDLALGETRSVIYFTRDINGDPKVLFFTQPHEIVYVLKDPKIEKDQQIKELSKRITDTDHDLLVDEVENCLHGEAAESNCAKTDPNSIDTDKDGWWDSTQMYLKR